MSPADLSVFKAIEATHSAAHIAAVPETARVLDLATAAALEAATSYFLPSSPKSFGSLRR